jgi:hypothetical protein
MEVNRNTKQQLGTSYSQFLHGLSASPYYGLALFFSNVAIPEKEKLKSENIKMIIFGLLSAVLYFFLFKYQAEIVHFAELTRQGVKIDFAIPVLIALIFSFAHGGFTTYLWQSLGLKSKNDLGKEQAWTPYNL